MVTAAQTARSSAGGQSQQRARAVSSASSANTQPEQPGRDPASGTSRMYGTAQSQPLGPSHLSASSSLLVGEQPETMVDGDWQLRPGAGEQPERPAAPGSRKASGSGDAGRPAPAHAVNPPVLGHPHHPGEHAAQHNCHASVTLVT